ncbi:hypothetical protein [Candidatus Wolbachia massiliensis]|uniref:Uncharacterized protein n=1 Tax=Candidatus Wolbachia massiliensis TaxID=1845000 RepID=A0A7L7YPK1_9RICK|nr:hypothetical protein [Candidatus Wolbachia massiliensis]QOD37919.1 hypothetical protein ID128_03605 [Candidatus Wolbachia massiliensis]
MDNTITFELPINEYNIESSFNHRDGSGSIQVWGYDEENPVSLLDYNRFHDPDDLSGMTYRTTLTLSDCFEDGLQKDLSINKIEFVHEGDNPTINVEFQAKTAEDIQAIKDSMKDCGFKVK